MTENKNGKTRPTWRGKGRRTNGASSSNKREQNSNKTKSDHKKTIQDCIYFLSNSKQAHDFEQTTEFVLNHIKETFEYGADIYEAMRGLTPIDTNTWAPSLQISKIASGDDTKKDQQEAEQRQFDFQYKEDYRMHKQRVTKYELNLTKAHALLIGRCTKGMKEKLKARMDWELKVSKDPIELLKAIKEEALSYQDNKYPAAIVLNALTNLLTCKQQHGESLQDYTSRFKNYRDVLMSQMGGPIVIQKMVEVDPSFTAAAAKSQDKLKDIQTKTYKEFLASSPYG